MLNKMYCAAIAVILGMSPLCGVEYEGEKSYMLEMKYDICLVSPLKKEIAEKGIKVISAKQAKALHDRQAHFYDAREKRHYNKQHIKGAKLIDFDRSKAEYMTINLPKDKDEALVFYCYGESCASSYEAASAVKKQGYKNVYWMINGFTQWKAKGYPLE